MNIRRGDIYYVCENDHTTGCEQSGCRPAVIVSNNVGNKYSPVVSVVYLTAKPKKPLPTHVDVECRRKSIALCEQVYTVSKDRLGDYVRSLTDEEVERVNQALISALGLGGGYE